MLNKDSIFRQLKYCWWRCQSGEAYSSKEHCHALQQTCFVAWLIPLVWGSLARSAGVGAFSIDSLSAARRDFSVLRRVETRASRSWLITHALARVPRGLLLPYVLSSSLCISSSSSISKKDEIGMHCCDADTSSRTFINSKKNHITIVIACDVSAHSPLAVKSCTIISFSVISFSEHGCSTSKFDYKTDNWILQHVFPFCLPSCMVNKYKNMYILLPYCWA